MQSRLRETKRGFTLIELLVVIAIIGVLSSVVLASLSTAREKARDARRKSDLKQIQLALELYFNENGTYAVSGSGASGTGTGWFSYEGGVYPNSVAQQLVDEGFAGGMIVDPSGVLTNSGNQSGYMIQGTATSYTLWANLENPSAADTATLTTCPLSGYDGYSSTYPAAARMNYCIGG